MLGGKNQKPKDKIIEILSKGPRSGKGLKTALANGGHKVSIQIIYKQLNELIEDEIILKTKKLFFINNEWVKNVSKIIDIQDIELPEEGEKFTYKFNSLQNLDAHWKHVMSSFRKKFAHEAFFSYCPHQIWIYVPSRDISEQNMKNEHEYNKYYNFYIVGGDTLLDKKFKKEFQGDFYRVETYVLKGEKRNKHLSVFNNIIVTTTFKKELGESIDAIFKKQNTIDQQELALKKLLSDNHSCTFIIEGNKNKALKLKKKISQPFYIPEEVRNQIKNHSL